ncbi:MAG: hypothetical protein ABI835_22315 [Chloroflexota bacterium]
MSHEIRCENFVGDVEVRFVENRIEALDKYLRSFFGREPSSAYLVMRWLCGNLRASIEHKPWKLETAALTVAHPEGIVHRDIKPENIL